MPIPGTCEHITYVIKGRMGLFQGTETGEPGISYKGPAQSQPFFKAEGDVN